MNQSISKQFIIGLPSAGKTTFLAALWHIVETKEVEGSLVLSHLQGDYSYLNNMRDLWADSEKLPRNKLGYEHIVSMHLLNPEDDSITELFFPDLSGESFQLQWTDRQIEKKHLDIIKEASGGLLFIHPAHVTTETLISDATKIVQTVKNASRLGDSNSNGAFIKEDETARELHPEINHESDLLDANKNKEKMLEKEYESINAPTQVQLVDILQVVSKFNLNRPIKIAVIVSAWDLIKATVQPQQWVAQYLPLLFQYLVSNENVFDCNFFGISAQGGCLEDATRLRKYIKQSERISVLNNDIDAGNDITLPVKWVMEQ